MRQLLQVLIVEDNPDDAELVVRELRQAGFDLQWSRVETEPDFLSALQKKPDIILSDYSMPQFSGLRALELLGASGLDIPLILISGTVGEDVAVEAMKCGAMDYLLKDRIARLSNAVERALKEKQSHEERKQVETALRQSEERKAAILAGALDAIITVNHEGIVVDWNPTAEKIFGYRREEVMGRMMSEVIIPPRMREDHQQGVKRMISAGENRVVRKLMEMPALRADGTEFPVEFFITCIQKEPPLFTGFLRDITERKHAERNIQQLNRVYAVLSEINQTIVREKDPAAMLASACHIAVERGRFRMAWIGMLSAKTQIVVPMASAGVIDGYLDQLKIDLKDEARAKGPTSMALLTGEHVICNDIETEPLAAAWHEEALKRGYRSSAAFPIKVNGETIGVFNLYSDESHFFDAGEVRLLDELATDISFALEIHEREKERQRVEEELRWRTALFEAQVESSVDGLLVVDSQGRKILQNQRMSDLWKIPPHIANDPDDIRQIQFVAGRTKNPDQFAQKVNYLYAHPDETSRDEVELDDGTILERYSSAVRGKDEKYYGRIWTFRDITERRKLEDQFRQSQKMDAIGQLAGGVAHDFNNILAVIQMQAGLLQAEQGLLPAHLEYAREIEASAQRAANLTRQLLLFSRRQVMRLGDFDLNENVSSITKMLQRILGEDIKMQLKFAARSLFVHADPGMIDQVLMNLAVNSRDAMPKGGLLVIETSFVQFDESTVAQGPRARAGSFACLSVSDTGLGISKEVMPRIFEPFFTTKEVGKGTGLGLATVFGIVQQHQGWINVYSETGRGTTFRIYLPCLASPAEKSSVGSTLANVRGGAETILVVEDDPSLRASVCVALRRLGYRVIEAVDGVEALKIWSQQRKEIHLLLTDLVMPGGMTGKELAEQILKDNPKLKVIYSSGYSLELAEKDFSLHSGVNFLTKPFQIAELGRAIRTQLDG